MKEHQESRSRLPRTARLVALSIVLAQLALASTSSADDAGGGWKTTRVENGITVSRKEVLGSPCVAFRGEGDVDAPLLVVGSVLVDIARAHEWVDSLAEARILRRVSDTEYVTYSHVKTPVTMTDREFVNDVTIRVDPTTRALSVHMRATIDAAAPKTSFVRGDLTGSSFTLTSIDRGTKTHVVAEIRCDPKGSVAGWIVNFFQRNWGFKTITSLRRQASKKDISIHPKLKSVLDENGLSTDPREERR
jgi:START domain